MAVMRLGYAHVRVTDMAEAKDHYANTLGLYETKAEGNKVYYKAWDEWDHHSVVLEEGGVGLVKYGWKVQYSSDIDEIEKKAQTFGVTVERMSRGENPEIGDGIRFTTPSDHVFEVYHEATLIGRRAPEVLEVVETGRESTRWNLRHRLRPARIDWDGYRFTVETVERVDWEVELAIVIGRRMRRVPAERALDHVLGYTVANDVSARDLQFGDGQWTRGKSLDTFCPLGPWIETDLDPGAQRIVTMLDGEIVQDGPTSDMVHDVASLVAFASEAFTLLPGDVILTGTPAGVGQIRPGDTVEVEIEGIGTLSNLVVAQDA